MALEQSGRAADREYPTKTVVTLATGATPSRRDTRRKMAMAFSEGKKMKLDVYTSQPGAASGRYADKALDRSASDAVATEEYSDSIAFTVMAKKNGYLTKLITPKEGGTGFAKDGSLCRMSAGNARRVEAANLSKVAHILERLQANEAVTLGVFADDARGAEIVAKAAYSEGTRTRTKGGPDGFVFQENRPCLLLIDMDLDCHIDGYDGTVETAWRFLTEKVSWLEDVGYIGRPSTSSGIFKGELRLDDPGTAGMHFYLVAQNGSEVPELLKRINSELWLKGLGHIKISASGQRLFRTPVDATVGSPERLVFEAPPVLMGGLTQQERTFSVCEGRKLVLAGIPPLSVFDCFKIADIRAAAYDAAEMSATQKREQWEESRQKDLMRLYIDKGISEAEASSRARVDVAAFRLSVLSGGTPLIVECDAASEDSEASVTVDALYEEAGRWDGIYCRDPEEPGKGPQKARLRLDQKGWLHLHSWLHGGRDYLLRPSLEGALERIKRWDELSATQREALLRDCGRAEADDVGILAIYDALAQRGLRRGDIKRVVAAIRKEAGQLVELQSQSLRIHTPFEMRAINDEATQAEIALDARQALTIGGVAPVFDQGELYVVEDGVWRAVERPLLRTWIGMSYRHCAVVRRTPDCKAVLSALEDAAAKRGFFDDTRPGVAIRNRFWTVSETGELADEPLRPEHGARFRLPFSPDFACGDPPMLGSLFTMVFDPDTRNDFAFSLGALMGCAVLGLGHKFKEAGFLIGAGDTGKSTLGALLSLFLPPSAVAAVPLGQMGANYSLAQLAGARLNLPGEEAADVVIPAAALKQITGGDPLSARLPYGQPFSFVSRALQWFTANKMPPLREHEKQVYRRIVFILFTHEIPADKRIGKTEIAAKKIFESEGAQILGWVMTCAAKAIATETMQTKATLDASRGWRETEDTVLDAFLGSDGCFVVTGSNEDQISAANAFRQYQQYTQEAGRKPLGRNLFYDRIKSSSDLIALGVTIVEDRKGHRLLAGVWDKNAEAHRRIEALKSHLPPIASMKR